MLMVGEAVDGLSRCISHLGKSEGEIGSLKLNEKFSPLPHLFHSACPLRRAS